MWTGSTKKWSIKLTNVWSELCGMWTLLLELFYSLKEHPFDLNYVGCELGSTYVKCAPSSCLIWTMWDVNSVGRAVLEEENDRGFDLNYVGCEHSKDGKLTKFEIKFDLNYVGCELVFCVVNRILVKSLIWTMWDVNREDARNSRRTQNGLIWTMWDVNDDRELAIFWTFVCLIWTMWDVNWFQKCACCCACSSFDLNYVGCELLKISLTISTSSGRVWSELCGMWTRYGRNKRCNWFSVWSELCGMWTFFTTSASTTYDLVWSELCGMWTGKLWTSSEKAPRLIWTMWDVNVLDTSRKMWLSGRLIWTMWDVNDEDTLALQAFFEFDLNYVGCERWDAIYVGNCPYVFDLNYVGCEHTSRRQKQKSLWTFDLNYVGCERALEEYSSCSPYEFDLNYVGCELRLRTCSSRLAIWDWSELCGMWTSFSRAMISFLFRFDLNYVGCEQKELHF